MAPLMRIEPPKTHKGRKILEAREPKTIESGRKAIFIKSTSSSPTTTAVLKDLYNLKKPDAVQYTVTAWSLPKDAPDAVANSFDPKRHEIFPFENILPVEKICKKFDSSLFCFGRNSKKKPNSIIFGRLFDGQLLDMFEFTVDKFSSINDFPGSFPDGFGVRPLLIFSGEEFELDTNRKQMKNFFIDFFRGEANAGLISLQGVKYVINFYLKDNKLSIRPYSIQLFKSDSSTPRVELLPTGPFMDLTIHRARLATVDLYEESYKIPKELKIKKKKNMSVDAFKSKLGNVHMERQDYAKLELRKERNYKHAEPNKGLVQQIEDYRNQVDSSQ